MTGRDKKNFCLHFRAPLPVAAANANEKLNHGSAKSEARERLQIARCHFLDDAHQMASDLV
jgi:hypothetical protein